MTDPKALADLAESTRRTALCGCGDPGCYTCQRAYLARGVLELLATEKRLTEMGEGLHARANMLEGERDAALRERDELRNARPDRDYEIMREERDQAIDEVLTLTRERDELRGALDKIASTSYVHAVAQTKMQSIAIAALARLAPARCPNCGGPADNGFDRELPPNAYYCTKCSDSAVGEE